MAPDSPWRVFFAELKRRRVWRVAVAYVVTGVAVVETADLFFPRLMLPDWTVTLIAVLVVLGFPLALVLAWAFQLTPEGVRRTQPSDGQDPIGARAALLLLVGLALLAGGSWWLLAAGDDFSGGMQRLAVLPLANLTGTAEQEYFVDGMHDALIGELQQAGVSVIARTSVMGYEDGETPVRDIARELDVDGVVEGTVFRFGDSVEIEARLVDPETEQYVWRESFAGSLRNVVALYRDVTRSIAHEIQAALAPEDEARLARASPVDPEAYEAYLKGEFHLERFTREDFDTALEYYERALAIDSTYAPAHLGVARVWSYRAQASAMTGVTAAEARKHWEPALERALALDSTLAEAHAHRAATLVWAEWRFQEGLEQFQRALELNPGLARPRMSYSHLLTILGDWEEARRQAERALETDPLNPFIQGLYGVHLTLTRRHEEAIAVLEEMYRKYPGAGFGRAPLIASYEQTGRYRDALRVQKERYRLRGDSSIVAILERGDREGGSGRAGYREALLRVGETLAARARAGGGSGEMPWGPYLSAGEEEKALFWLEKAVEVRNQNMPYIGVRPTFEPLHDHPRFRELAKRVGVPILTGPASP